MKLLNSKRKLTKLKIDLNIPKNEHFLDESDFYFFIDLERVYRIIFNSGVKILKNF